MTVCSLPGCQRSFIVRPLYRCESAADDMIQISNILTSDNNRCWRRPVRPSDKRRFGIREVVVCAQPCRVIRVTYSSSYNGVMWFNLMPYNLSVCCVPGTHMILLPLNSPLVTHGELSDWPFGHCGCVGDAYALRMFHPIFFLQILEIITKARYMYIFQTFKRC